MAREELQVVGSALTADDEIFVPLGPDASAPGDRGTRIDRVYTRAELVPGGRFRGIRASDFLAAYEPYDELVIDGDDGEPVGIGPSESTDLLFSFHQFVPSVADIRRARIARLPAAPRYRATRLLVQTAERMGAAAYSATLPPASGGRITSAALVVARGGSAPAVAEALRTAFDRTPHRVVLVGARRDFPWRTRIHFT